MDCLPGMEFVSVAVVAPAISVRRMVAQVPQRSMAEGCQPEMASGVQTLVANASGKLSCTGCYAIWMLGFGHSV